ncbi:MAG: hypothetical protein F4X56_00525 [Gammaproteobacteria bacterium]|nr:hypothetical protein [Gammaproteobacteria bacterium]
MKLLLIGTLGLLANSMSAQNLSGTYEFPEPYGLEGGTYIVQLNKDEEGNYSVSLTISEIDYKGKNVMVSENRFTFEIEPPPPLGTDIQITQFWKIQIADGEANLSIDYEIGGESESISVKGRLVLNLEGTYEFPPPKGLPEDTISVQLMRDEENNIAVTVTVGDDTIKANNIVVGEDQFSFDTEVDTPIGNMSQTFKIKVSDTDATLSIVVDVDGQSELMTLKGMLIDEKTDSE